MRNNRSALGAIRRCGSLYIGVRNNGVTFAIERYIKRNRYIRCVAIKHIILIACMSQPITSVKNMTVKSSSRIEHISKGTIWINIPIINMSIKKLIIMKHALHIDNIPNIPRSICSTIRRYLFSRYILIKSLTYISPMTRKHVIHGSNISSIPIIKRLIIFSRAKHSGHISNIPNIPRI